MTLSFSSSLFLKINKTKGIEYFIDKKHPSDYKEKARTRQIKYEWKLTKNIQSTN